MIYLAIKVCGTQSGAPYFLRVESSSATIHEPMYRVNLEGLRAEIDRALGDVPREESNTKHYREVESLNRTIAALRGALTKAKKAGRSK